MVDGAHGKVHAACTTSTHKHMPHGNGSSGDGGGGCTAKCGPSLRALFSKTKARAKEWVFKWNAHTKKVNLRSGLGLVGPHTKVSGACCPMSPRPRSCLCGGDIMQDPTLHAWLRLSARELPRQIRGIGLIQRPMHTAHQPRENDQGNTFHRLPSPRLSIHGCGITTQTRSPKIKKRIKCMHAMACSRPRAYLWPGVEPGLVLVGL